MTSLKRVPFPLILIAIILPFHAVAQDPCDFTSSGAITFPREQIVIRLYDTNNWVDVVREGIEHACENSERLIIDVRGGGGNTAIRWLYHYLFPEDEELVEAGSSAFRIRNDNAKLNEPNANAALLESLYVPQGLIPCFEGGNGPVCYMDLDTGETLPLSLLDWHLDPSVTEQRGGVSMSLSRQVGFSQNYEGVFPEFDTASCAGRFVDNNLIFLTDGVNRSGSYFLPAAFKGKGEIVTMGGFVDEPIAMGNARGGVTIGASIYVAIVEQINLISGGLVTFKNEYLGFERVVESQMEMWGMYRKDRLTLHLDNPVEADLRLYAWSDSPETDGYVYGRLLKTVDAVKRRMDRRFFRHDNRERRQSFRH